MDRDSAQDYGRGIRQLLLSHATLYSVRGQCYNGEEKLKGKSNMPSCLCLALYL